ncbi:MAG: serine/threonine protein kinase [Gemmataceae bacterium]|nr:serine/threonine protein kinase [Gemmataceae bacterium]
MLGKMALGKYRLLHPLGSGSNAEVFLAEHVKHPGRRVVVKRVHDHVVTHPKFPQLFEAEVRSMRNFTHPYAVRLLDASLDDPLGPCLVMEYVPGLTLEDLLRKQRRLDPPRVARLLGYLCHALQAAHDAGIIHRDLKPANLMVTTLGRPGESIKVMDFGFAGFVTKPHIQLAELTGHGPIYAIGTPAYVSPEMIRGDPVDPRSDLYSVGVILFELLTGRLPFDHDRQDKLLAAHVREAPPRMHKIGCGHVPPGVEGVVQLALSKYPNERQQSARELAEEFGRAIGEDVWDQSTPVGEEPGDRPVVVHHTPPVARPAPDLPPDPYLVSDAFEVTMPDRLAAAKLRGFVEDVGGEVLASDPGVILLRLGAPAGYKPAPPGKTGLFGWLATLRQPGVARGQEPIELEFRMEKPDPSFARLRVSVICRPLKEYPPQNRTLWQERCGKLHTMLRQYLGA